MLITTSYNFGDIILVPFPFTDQTRQKKRPAVVINSIAYDESKPDVILMAVTSKIHTRSCIGEFQVQNWQTAGLLKPSVVKPVITTLEKRLIIRKLGQLQSIDLELLQKSIKQILH